MVEFIISSLSGCSTRIWTQQDRLPCGFYLIIIRPKLTQILTNIIRVPSDAVRPEIHQMLLRRDAPFLRPSSSTTGLRHERLETNNKPGYSKPRRKYIDPARVRRKLMDLWMSI